MIFYLIRTNFGYFSGFRRRFPFFRLRAEYHWDTTLESGPLKVFRNEREARNFITDHRHLFPIDVMVKAHEFNFIAGS